MLGGHPMPATATPGHLPFDPMVRLGVTIPVGANVPRPGDHWHRTLGRRASVHTVTASRIARSAALSKPWSAPALTSRHAVSLPGSTRPPVAGGRGGPDRRPGLTTRWSCTGVAIPTAAEARKGARVDRKSVV